MMEKIFEKLIFILKILTITICTIALFLFVYSYLSNIPKQKDIDILSENWQFEFYQDGKLVENLIIDLPFDLSGHINNQKGVVVLKQKLNLSKYKNPGIRLGKLSDGVEVYLNDLLIAEYGKKADIIFSAYNFDKTINLFKFVNKEEFAEVKIAIYILTNCSITQPFYLGEYENLTFKSELSNLFNVKIKRFLFLIIFIISILFFYIGIKEKRKELVYFSISSIFVLLFSLNQLLEYLPINYITFNYILVYKSIYLLIIFFYLSFFYLIKEKFNLFIKVVLSFFVLFFIIDTILYKNYELRKKFYTYELILGILSFLYLVLYVFKRYFYDKNKKMRKFLFPFSILFFTIINDMFAFTFPQSYPQFYTMILGFEIYILILSRLILNELIETFIITNNKNIEIGKSNESLKNYLNNISSSLELIKKNDNIFNEVSKDLTEKSQYTKSQIDLLNQLTLKLNELNNKINDIDKKIVNLAQSQIKIGNQLRNVIDLNSNNFNFMKSKLNITKEFSNQIEEISKQTSLLGLNASIESSRSSDYYKSFSVVANEVKNLASKSTDLVSKIKNIADETILSTDSGIESSKILSKYFEDFYYNFQQFMSILNQNTNILKSVEDNFNEISKSILNLINVIEKLDSYAQQLENRNQ